MDSCHHITFLCRRKASQKENAPDFTGGVELEMLTFSEQWQTDLVAFVKVLNRNTPNLIIMINHLWQSTSFYSQWREEIPRCKLGCIPHKDLNSPPKRTCILTFLSNVYSHIKYLRTFLRMHLCAHRCVCLSLLSISPDIIYASHKQKLTR